MEFEENKPTSDADRRLAEAKKLTLQPVHANITVDTPTDTELSARHLSEPAIANIATDIESTTTFIQPTNSLLGQQNIASKPQTNLMISFTVGTAIFAGLVVIALLK